MKTYVLKVAATVAIIMLCHYAILLTIWSPIAAEYWVREFIVVKRYEAASMPSPKLIFVGGSCTLFGIDAAQVQKSLGIPAINFGLHAGLRLEAHLAEARFVAKPGDIVIISLEPAYYDYYTFRWNSWDVRNAIAWDHENLESLPLPRRLQIYLESSDILISLDLLWSDAAEHFFPAAIHRRLQAMAPEQTIIARYLAERETSRAFAFAINNIDANGDVLNTQGTGLDFRGNTWAPTRPSTISPYAESVLTPFLAEMKSRRVRVIFDYTPYLVYEKPGEEWKASEARFQEEIHRIGGELLERRDAFFYPSTLFFNSNLHLNAEGRELRTQTLIEALKKRLGLPTVAP